MTYFVLKIKLFTKDTDLFIASCKVRVRNRNVVRLINAHHNVPVIVVEGQVNFSEGWWPRPPQGVRRN